MKKLILFYIFFIFSNLSLAKEIYKIDSTHTKVTWHASHFGFSKPSGQFSNVSGLVEIDRNNPQNSSVEIAIQTNSLSTGLEKFDAHLQSADFLNIENYPTITFKSSAISPYTKSKARIRGILSLLGVEKMVTLDVILNKEGKNPISQKQTIGFSATTTINRSDFGMTFGLPGISDEVEISIELEAILVEITQENYSNDFMKKTSKNNVPSWQINPEHSKLEFTAYQNNSNIDGSFKDFDGEINFDKNDLDNSHLNINIYTTSISMPFTDAIEVVKSDDWLGTGLFRKATFISTRIYPSSSLKQFKADGHLMIKDIKIPTTIEFILNEYSKTKARVTGNTTIKRTRFNVGPRSRLKAQGVDDRVDIRFDISAERN